MFMMGAGAQIRIAADPEYYDALANTVKGEKLVLARETDQSDSRIAVLNESQEIIGWLPPDDPIVAKLLGGSRYQATAANIVRGSGLTRFTNIYLSITLPLGDLKMPPDLK